MTIRIDNRDRFDEVLHGRWNLFAGAGFSVCASSVHGILPTGKVLANDLRKEFGVDPACQMLLPQLATVIEAVDSDGLADYLRSRFTVASYDPRYDALTKFDIAALFTTNIDNLLPLVFGRPEGGRPLKNIYADGRSLDSRVASYVPFHGNVLDSRKKFTFATLDLAMARSDDPDAWNFFRDSVQQAPTLYWGYAMADSGTLQSLRPRSVVGETVGEAWVQVYPDAQADTAATVFRSMGFQVILGTTEELLDYVERVSDGLESCEVEVVGDGGNVPSSGAVVLKPLEDFFLGRSAEWSDVYSSELHKIGHFNEVSNRISKPGNTILAGIPGCGKSTLLMQLAALRPFEGVRYYFSMLDYDDAELCIREIGDRRALVCVDNVTRDVEAFNALATRRNITLIAADRDYNIGRARRLFKGLDEGSIINVSSLTPQDIERLWRSIPAKWRTNKRVLPRVDDGFALSVVEFVSANVRRSTLADRLVEAVHQMAHEDGPHAELLLLAAYFGYSRSLLPIDVVIAYFANQYSYVDIYAAVDELGDLVADFWDRDGDVFAIRSELVAQAVLFGVERALLASVLRRFNRNVSQVRVANVREFTSRAYGWRLYNRAFPNAGEGENAYDEVVTKTGDDRVLEQKGLYLAERRNFPDAFRALDGIRGARKGVNWSVEGSFYWVQFRANIDKVDTPDGRVAVLEAMDGLVRCVEGDRRKGFPALRLASAAIMFADVVGESDGDALRYLGLASGFLEEVVDQEPWMTKPPEQLDRVRRAIRRGRRREFGAGAL